MISVIGLNCMFRGGICLWAASYPGNAATARSGIAPLFGTVARGSGIRWTVVDFLRSQNDEQISALSWSPNGRYPNKLLSSNYLYYLNVLSCCHRRICCRS